MITSFYDGRVRIRTKILENPDTMALLESAVMAQDGIIHTKANTRTGSLLVLYDPEKIPRETLATAVTAFEEQLAYAEAAMPRDKERTESCRKILKTVFDRKTELALLTSLFCLTVFSGAINKKLHLGLGALLTVFTAKHLYKRRRCF